LEKDWTAGHIAAPAIGGANGDDDRLDDRARTNLNGTSYGDRARRDVQPEDTAGTVAWLLPTDPAAASQLSLRDDAPPRDTRGPA
jgi:hypothetical protein